MDIGNIATTGDPNIEDQRFSEPHFSFTDDGKALKLYTPLAGHPGVYSISGVITEEIFQECYRRWIVAKGLDR